MAHCDIVIFFALHKYTYLLTYLWHRDIKGGTLTTASQNFST